ncbi:hypothetical protein [Parasediminibacterium sp. JCM 36343]|uniref:hypothetical protein n=1 Tax=Parasediminibacterium sp. JCM 36343 TaxID=3374279 RepID=UPI00397E7440
MTAYLFDTTSVLCIGIISLVWCLYLFIRAVKCQCVVRFTLCFVMVFVCIGSFYCLIDFSESQATDLQAVAQAFP